MTTNPQTTTQESEVAERRVNAGSLRLALYFFAFALGVTLMFILPPPYPTVVFVVLVVWSLGLGIREMRSADITLGDILIPSPAIRLPRLPAVPAAISAHRNKLAFVFSALSFAFMIAAALDFRPMHERELLADAVLKMLAGALLLGVAVWLSDRQPALPMPTDQAIDKPRRFWWIPALVGIGALAALAEINGGRFNIAPLKEVSQHVQYWLLMVGMALLTWGFAGMPIPRPRRFRVDWRALLPLLAILALALFLRLWRLNETLPVLIDEVHWSDAIMALNSRPNQPILSPMSGQSPYTWIFPYWQSFAVKTLGYDFFGFRFVSAIVGTINVLAVWALARTLFDRKTALLAALIMATFPPHVHFSRVAMTLIADPLFGTLMLMFVARGMKYNRRIDWALGGVCLGMTQFFFEGGRLLFPLLLLVWSGLMIVISRKHLRPQWRGLMITLLVGALIAAPMYYTLVAEGKSLFGRMDDSGLGTSYWRQRFADGITMEDITDQIRHTLTGFMIYVTHPDMSVYYGGQQALILEWLVPVFLFGAFYLLWRLPAPAFLISLWIVSTSLGNGLLRDTIVAARYYVVLPALATALAVGIRYLAAFIWTLKEERLPDAERPREPRLRFALTLALVGAISVAQVIYYYGIHLDYFNVQVRDSKPYRDGIDAALRSAELPPNTQVYLVGMPEHDQNVPRNFLGFLTQDSHPDGYFPLLSLRTDQLSPRYLLELRPGINHAFFVEADEVETIALLRNYFPTISPPQFSLGNVPAHKEYVLLFLPAETELPRLPNKWGNG